MPGEREGKSDFQELSRIQESLHLDSALFLRWTLWPDSVRPGCSWVLGQNGGRKPVKVLPTRGAAGGVRVESKGSGRDRSTFEQFNKFSPAERGRALPGREAWRRPGAEEPSVWTPLCSQRGLWPRQPGQAVSGTLSLVACEQGAGGGGRRWGATVASSRTSSGSFPPGDPRVGRDGARALGHLSRRALSPGDEQGQGSAVPALREVGTRALRWGLEHCSRQTEEPFAESPCSAPRLACAGGVIERTPAGSRAQGRLAPSCGMTHPAAYWAALDPEASLVECHLQRARWTGPARALGGNSGWGGSPCWGTNFGRPWVSPFSWGL